MKRRKRSGVNPLAGGMSLPRRLMRYNQDKDRLYRENPEADAIWLEEQRKRLERWWNV